MVRFTLRTNSFKPQTREQMEVYSTSVVARGLAHSNMHRTQDKFRQLSKPTITTAVKQLASTSDTIRASFSAVFETGACTQSVVSAELLPYLALINPPGNSQGELHTRLTRRKCNHHHRQHSSTRRPAITPHVQPAIEAAHVVSATLIGARRSSRRRGLGDSIGDPVDVLRRVG